MLKTCLSSAVRNAAYANKWISLNEEGIDCSVSVYVVVWVEQPAPTSEQITKQLWCRFRPCTEGSRPLHYLDCYSTV